MFKRRSDKSTDNFKLALNFTITIQLIRVKYARRWFPILWYYATINEYLTPITLSPKSLAADSRLAQFLIGAPNLLFCRKDIYAFISDMGYINSNIITKFYKNESNHVKNYQTLPIKLLF